MRLLDEDENLRDGLRFKNELSDSNSPLSCLRAALYVLREKYIQKAKNAHMKKNEERASYFMGCVDGIDQCIQYPESMIQKWERMVEEKMFAPRENITNGA